MPVYVRRNCVNDFTNTILLGFQIKTAENSRHKSSVRTTKLEEDTRRTGMIICKKTKMFSILM